MKPKKWTRGFARALTAASVPLILGFITPIVEAAPAHSGTNVGFIVGVEARCDSSSYYLCLYYNGFDSAWWGASTSVSDLGGARFFPNTGEGSGQLVAVNASSVSCDASSTSFCYLYFNPGYSGPFDWLYGQRGGRLVEVYKNVGSVRISIGA